MLAYQPRNSFHRLHVQQRVQFKTLSLMVNCLVGVAPIRLRSFCTLSSSMPARTFLRSSSRGFMVIPRMRSAAVQYRSFAYVAHWLGTVLSSTVPAPGITSLLTPTVTKGALTFGLPRGGGTHPLRLFRCHTFCIWNKILTFKVAVGGPFCYDRPCHSKVIA